MKHILLFLFLLLSLGVFGQRLVEPCIRYGCHYNSASLFGTTGSLLFEGASSSIHPDIINGYPSVRVDSLGGYFTFISDFLLEHPHALFLIVYQLEGDSIGEQGLWSILHGSRSRGLSSTDILDGSRRLRYNYNSVSGVNVTTNYVSLRPVADTSSIAAADTFYICKTDSMLFRGKLAEFMVIDTAFSDRERQVWQSYLSLKYGVTISQGDYLNSSGDTLWHYSGNEAYSLGVGGIGRDSILSLSQNFSRIYGDSVKISLHNYISQVHQTVDSPFSEGDYIFWGHNGGSVEVGNEYYYLVDSYYHLYRRQWKVRPYLHSAKSLDISLRAGALPFTFWQAGLSDIRLFVSTDSGFSSYETHIYTPSFIEGHEVIFSDINIASGIEQAYYFTFGYSSEVLSGQSGGSSSGGTTGGNSSDNPALEVFTRASYLPNPVIDNLYVHYTLTRDAMIWFSVHTNSGIPVCQTPVEHRSTGENQTLIPMSNLITGTYIVYIHVDDMILQQTVIKQ